MTTVSTINYERTWRQKPRRAPIIGGWMFHYQKNVRYWAAPYGMFYGDAKKLAIEWAEACGFDSISVSA